MMFLLGCFHGPFNADSAPDIFGSLTVVWPFLCPFRARSHPVFSRCAYRSSSLEENSQKIQVTKNVTSDATIAHFRTSSSWAARRRVWVW